MNPFEASSSSTHRITTCSRLGSGISFRGSTGDRNIAIEEREKDTIKICSSTSRAVRSHLSGRAVALS
jgi:hypothetical protein